MTEQSTGGQGMRTIDRALVLLGLVCDADGITLTEAARRADLSASTALRLLRALEHREFVRRDDDGAFTAGPHLVQLGAAALSNTALVAQTRDAMRRVAQGTTESCYLSVFGVGDTAMHLAIAEGTQSIRHVGWVGRTIPLTDTAVGRVLLDDVGEDGYVVVAEGAERDVTAVSARCAPATGWSPRCPVWSRATGSPTRRTSPASASTWSGSPPRCTRRCPHERRCPDG
ncbi:helix-turn-helix domain-containing protein [Curtobacterium flaccumfaciens]|nr:helix-turn-helix domain-containing protein [Curtobacterium flaccumfaciens]